MPRALELEMLHGIEIILECCTWMNDSMLRPQFQCPSWLSQCPSLVDKANNIHKLLHNSTGKMVSCQDDIRLYNQRLNLRTATHNEPSYKQH